MQLELNDATFPKFLWSWSICTRPLLLGLECLLTRRSQVQICCRKKMTEALRSTALTPNGGQVPQSVRKNTESPDGVKKERWDGSSMTMRKIRKSYTTLQLTWHMQRRLILCGTCSCRLILFIRLFRRQRVKEIQMRSRSPEQNRL